MYHKRPRWLFTHHTPVFHLVFFFSLGYFNINIILKNSFISRVSGMCSCQCLLSSIRNINKYMYFFSFLELCRKIMREIPSYSICPIGVQELNICVRNTMPTLVEIICNMVTNAQLNLVQPPLLIVLSSFMSPNHYKVPRVWQHHFLKVFGRIHVQLGYAQEENTKHYHNRCVGMVLYCLYFRLTPLLGVCIALPFWRFSSISFFETLSLNPRSFSVGAT